MSRRYDSNEIQQLVVRYLGGETQLAGEIAFACSGLIYAVIRRISWSRWQPLQPADVEDLLQQGFLGVLKALDKYDTQRMNSSMFTTFSWWWIRREVHRYYRQAMFIVAIPDGVHDRIAKVMKNDGSDERVKQVLRFHQQAVSSTSDFDDSELQSPCDELERADERMMFASILNRLSEREREVVGRLVGINYEPLDSLEQVAKRMNISRYRCAKILNGALSELRNQLKSSKFL